MKKFRYKFSPLAYVLIGLATTIAVAVIVINVISLARNTIMPDKIVSSCIAIFVAVLFLAFLIVMLCVSNYEITKTELKTRLGLIVTGVKLENITQIVLFPNEKRLSVIFKSEEFSNVVISPKQFEDFVCEIKKANPKILYIADTVTE